MHEYPREEEAPSVRMNRNIITNPQLTEISFSISLLVNNYRSSEQ
jgi:hypothetical protein